MQLRPWHGVVLVVLLLGVGYSLQYDWPFEDSYITFRYAENLLGGIGLRYNPNETVEGFTSFGWVVLLAAAGWCGLAIPTIAQVLSVLCGLGLLALTALMARRFTRLGSLWFAAPALLLAANGTWAYYSMTGMETTLFALLVNLAIWAAVSESGRAAIAAGVLVGLSALVRPEGFGYAGLIGIALLTDRRGRRQLLGFAAAFVLIFAPYLAWKWMHFGYPLPNTYYAKATPSSGVFRAGLVHVEEYFTTHAFWLAALGGAVLMSATPRPRWVRLLVVVLAGAVANAIFVGGDTFAFYRFLLPAMPAGLILMVEGGRLLGARVVASRPALAGVAGAAGGVAFVAILTLIALAPYRQRASLLRDPQMPHRQLAHNAAGLNRDYFAVGDWLRATFPPGTLIATNAAGIVPYQAGLPTIDMLGLNDEHIAHLPIELGHGARGHEKHDAAYILARKPDVILLGLPKLLRRPPRNAAELEQWFARWFPALPGDRDIFRSPAFRAEYRPLSAPIAPGRWVVVFVRKDKLPPAPPAPD